MLGIRHLLLRYATLPDLRYSALNGFGHHTEAVNWYMLYWTLLAVLFAWLAANRWQRLIAGMAKVDTSPNRMVKAGLTITCTIAFLCIGLYIHSQSTSTNGIREQQLHEQMEIRL